MKKANLIFKDNTPFSLDFDDFYFNSKDGINESKFVYSEAFEWSRNDNFIIAESGFGIGLNFFLTLQRFLKDENRPKNLFYVSIEGFYIEKDKLREIYKKLGFYEEFKEFLEPFLQFYPKAKKGYYRFYFQNCFLDLVFDDISVLKQLEFDADIWFLDGFSPSKNSEMFDENFVREVARLSKIGTQICTFSASSILQKNLKNNGFIIQKTKGFKKREMIKAFLEEKKLSNLAKEAYFQKVKNECKNNKIAIIGAGISSAILAYELSLRGFDVSIFEKNSSLDQSASGNESGILSSLILKPEVVLGEFSQNAFIEASRFYKQILGLKFNGVVEFAHNLKMEQRFLSQKDNVLFQFQNNKAFLEDGGHIKPKEIVKSLIEKSGAKLYLSYDYDFFEYENDEFVLHFKNQKQIQDFGILIYAMGADTKDFLNYEAMLLSKVRGQVTHLKPFLDTEFPLSSKAYICPCVNDLQVIGASYDRLNSNPNSQSDDDEENLQNIQEFLKGDESLIIKGSKVGFRSYSSDRFSIIGAAYDEKFYKEHYKALLWTKNKEQITPKNIPNLYLNFAHGSRGFSTAILAARYLCALINDEPLGIFKDFISHIHPARFLIRKLKKGL